MLKVGMIGAGRISDLHAIEYLANPDAAIVAVCDANREIAARQAEAWGVPDDRVFDHWDDLLAVDEVDLVEILLPHHLHCPATLAAAAAGKHVSVQKPMALSVAEADKMVEAADQAGVILKVFENFLFYPPVMKAKELVDAGAIGEPLTIRIKSNSGIGKNAWPVPAAAQAWRFDQSTCGGGPFVFDDGHHKFALAWHFMGQAEEVHAWIGETMVDDGVLDSPAMVSFRFPGNRLGNLEAVHSPALAIETRQYAQDDQLELTGTAGVLWVTRGHGRIGDRPPVILYRDGETRGFSDMATGWEQSFVGSVRQTIEAMAANAPPVLTGAQGREILRFALAAQESARRGTSVRLD